MKRPVLHNDKKEMAQVLKVLGLPFGTELPYCNHYKKFLHRIKDMGDNNFPFLRDCYELGCEWAHRREGENLKHWGRKGYIFPELSPKYMPQSRRHKENVARQAKKRRLGLINAEQERLNALWRQQHAQALRRQGVSRKSRMIQKQ